MLEQLKSEACTDFKEQEVASWEPFMHHKGWVLSAWREMFWQAVPAY